MSEKRLNSNSRQKYVGAALTGLYCAMVSAMPAFANGDVSTITNGISNGAQQIWNILVGVVAPIAAVALAFCAFKILWGGQRAAEEAKSTAIKIVIGIAIVLLAPSIISAVKGWFTQSTWGF